jgi:hypothetical protein
MSDVSQNPVPPCLDLNPFILLIAMRPGPYFEPVNNGNSTGYFRIQARIIKAKTGRASSSFSAWPAAVIAVAVSIGRGGDLMYVLD